MIAIRKEYKDAYDDTWEIAYEKVWRHWDWLKEDPKMRLISIMFTVFFCGCSDGSSNPKPAYPSNMRFSDRNGDGKIDAMQIDYTSHHLTAWIDDDLDGRFDRCIYEIEGITQTEIEVDIPVPLVAN